ncbi:hypothetical protein N665_0432s0028 [Sinapis alba]|nr:hypothetical protein N665_0432s0028 [Sinapis alba]
MAKVGKLTKLKSAIKKWPSFAKNHHHSSSSAAVSDELSEDNNLHVVYVGQTRRPYMLRPDIISHPLFQELVDRSSRSAEQEREIVVACEVVLFEHLLWIRLIGHTAKLLGATPDPSIFTTSSELLRGKFIASTLLLAEVIVVSEAHKRNESPEFIPDFQDQAQMCIPPTNENDGLS